MEGGMRHWIGYARKVRGERLKRFLNAASIACRLEYPLAVTIRVIGQVVVLSFSTAILSRRFSIVSRIDRFSISRKRRSANRRETPR